MRRLCILAAAFCFAVPAYAQAPTRDFVVFFETWSGALDRQAQSVIQAAAIAAKAEPSDKVIVTGTSDPEGSARANSLISALRAQQVTDALVGLGVAATRIDQVAYGSTDFALAGIESRRVTIAIGAK
jgi:outer membrane protein OmpA-like peptidoglycan-associated protein